MLTVICVILTIPLALFGGWIITGIGWVVALIWSLTGNTKSRAKRERQQLLDLVSKQEPRKRDRELLFPNLGAYMRGDRH